MYPLILAAVMTASSSAIVAPAAAQVALLDAAASVDPAPVIAAVRETLAANYVVVDRRGALDAALAAGLANGHYANLAPAALAERVTTDIVAVTRDKHLGLRHDPALAASLAGPERDETAFFADMARKGNHGVVEQRVLSGNVRYIDYRGFMWTGQDSGRVIDAAMAFLKGGDAAIIDLRRNGGGSPEAVNRMAGWFVPGSTTLVTFHMRQEPATTSVTAAVPPGTIHGIPVYVLTSARSASAAEEFAAHAAGFGFATLVGETTAGAAFRNEMFPIAGGYALSVSVGRPELPRGGDWEGRGIAPEIAVPEDRALATAQARALTTLAASASGPARTELQWAAAMQAALADPVAPSRALAEYVGRYGERVVSVDGSRLSYRRGGAPATMLVALGADLFAIEADPRTRIRFDGDGGLVVERVDGSRERAVRR